MGDVRWCPYCFLYVLPSLRGMFHYCFEYRVALYGESVIYLVSVFGFSVNVKFLQGVEHSSLSLKVNYVHYFVHWAKGVPFVNNMVGECGSVVCVFKVIVMFAVPYTDRPAGLTCVHLVALRKAASFGVNRQVPTSILGRNVHCHDLHANGDEKSGLK